MAVLVFRLAYIFLQIASDKPFSMLIKWNHYLIPSTPQNSEHFYDSFYIL